MSAGGADEQSLIEDASTLLLFSKTRSISGGSTKDTSGIKSINSSPREGSIQDHQNVIRSRRSSRTPTESGTLSPRNPVGSVGPASAALMQDDGVELVKSGSISPKTSSGFGHSNKKGIVAAAALAAAAIIPLPLKTEQRRKSKHEVQAVESSPSSVKHEWPVPNSYIVDIDSGIISCICGYDDDDGFTIQCDHCHRWQHAICYNIKDIETAPEDHLCNTCEPRKVDPKRARRRQTERLQRQENLVNRNSSTVGRGGSKDDSEADGLDKSNNNDKYSDPVDEGDKILENEDNYDGDSGNQSINDEIQDNTASTDDGGKRRRNNGDPGVVVDSKRRKNNIAYTSAKEAYSAMYLPVEECDFKDKYAKLFTEKHCDDDWVIPYTKKAFESKPIEVKLYAETNNAKVFSGYSKLGVYLKEACHRKEFICEYLGEVDFQKGYLMDPRNHYRIWGTSKPKVLFHPHWPLFIDARLCGNLARYVRRSCNPNVELATIRMPETNEVKFVLRALKSIEEGEEIHIGWQWDLRHPIWQLINKTGTFESLNDPDKYLLIHSVDTVLSACECACGNNNKECNLLKVKKFSQSLYRTVKSKMNNRYKLNEILNQYQGKRRRQPPILERLANETLQSSERASSLIAEYDEKKSRCLTNGTYDGIVAAGNLSPGESVKPYKWILKDKHRGDKHGVNEGSSSTASLQATNPAEFDESKVTDLNKLSIPIILKIPIESPTVKNNPQVESVLPPGSKDLSKVSDPANVATGKISDPILLASAQTETENYSTSTKQVPELVDTSKNPFKKKLSFADYRKKQHK